MLTVPAAMCGKYLSEISDKAQDITNAAAPEATGVSAEKDTENRTVSTEKIRVWFPSEKKTVETDLRSYLICVTAGEMPAAYEIEALKAQALAAATLVRRLVKEGNIAEGSDNASVTADAAVNQAYMSEDEMKKRWGGDYEKWHSRLEEAVDAVINYEIEYNGEPILAAFHAISSGVTEDAENVWGKSIPYLRSVESAGDKLAPSYASSVTLDDSEIKKVLGIESDRPVRELIKNARYTSAGTLTRVSVGDKEFTGEQLRKAFSLRSSSIRFGFSDGKTTLSVTGYGHGIGLSQYGADYYARQGCSWREIIAHYYPDTQIKEIK